MILLDTDILIDVTRRHPPALAWMRTLGRERLATSGYAAMELIQGCANRATLETVQEELSRFDVLWPSPGSCDRALRLFASAWLSHRLGLLDALIAHTAIEAGLALHTFNVRHFAVVPELQTMQPYAR